MHLNTQLGNYDLPQAICASNIITPTDYKQVEILYFSETRNFTEATANKG